MQNENARVSMISLGVKDIPAATEFYQFLGWQKSANSQDSISFMKGNNIVLGLYGRQNLADDAGVKNTSRSSTIEFSGIALALNLRSEDKVDEFAKLVTRAGGTIVKKPQSVFWGGYSGYFADKDGHLWEIAHNPFFKFDKNGNLDTDGDQKS